MARARKKLDWEGQFAMALDPDRAREYRANSPVSDHGACTMCGAFCAYKVMDEAMKNRRAGHGRHHPLRYLDRQRPAGQF